MREILFRGKRKYENEWVEGVPSFEDERGYMIHDLFICDEYQCTGSETIEILPETVGQYTGLTDKNGKKIFEGDIVIDKYSKEKFGFVGVVVYNPKLTQFQIYSDKQPDYVVNLGSRNQSVKVLGNIHDDSTRDDKGFNEVS